MGFQNLFFRKIRPEVEPFPTGFEAPLAPARPLYAVGDIHGRLDLLDALLEKVTAEWNPAFADLVFVGDYIDRGDQSAQVLERLRALQGEHPKGVHFLMGNHERMMLDFLERPTERGPRWLKYGGLQAMLSFGVRGISERMDDAGFLKARDALRAKMPKGTEEWLHALQLHFNSGNIWVVHAAANPVIPMPSQEKRTLMWGHKEFDLRPRDDGQWVVHGHTIVEEATRFQGRIAIDTGGYATDRLTAVHIEGGQARFLST